MCRSNMDNSYKMTYHIEPGMGLLNDPNGLIQYKGDYYFFHQWNRFGLDHSYKEWGLFTSKDMVNWQSWGSAVVPDREEDKNGIHSGSSIEYDGRLYLFYTGSNKSNGIRKSRQCIAISENGRTFIKQAEAIDTPNGFTEHHRDPKVWRGRNRWWMLVGAQKSDLTGAVALYSSDNLLHWKYESVLYDNDLDQVCECPDLFSLGEKDILVCCPQKRTIIQDVTGEREEVTSYACYIPGIFNENRISFTPGQDRKYFDYGFDFYSPQTFLDSKGRRIMAGWMSRMDEKQEACCPTREFGYIHCLTLPRVLTWENDTLYQRPVEEVFRLRHNAKSYTAGQGSFMAENGHFELHLKRHKNQTGNPLMLSLRNRTVGITYHPETHILEVSRKNWADGGIQVRQLSLPELSELQVFSDNSSAEIFVNNGAAVFSMRYFADGKDLAVEYAGLGQKGRLDYFTL